MFSRTQLSAAALALTIGAASSAYAGTFEFVLPDLGTFESFVSDDPGQTFRGTGFVGMINPSSAAGDETWAHLLGVESYSRSRTLMQLELAPLAGQKVLSATLRFQILDGADQGTNSIVVQGFDGGAGDLELSWRWPDHAHGSSVGNASAGSEAAIDITQQLRYSVDHGHEWLGLHLQAFGTKSLYTATYDPLSQLSPDRAGVRIDVITGAVPEPATWALMLGGVALMAGLRWRRRAAC